METTQDHDEDMIVVSMIDNPGIEFMLIRPEYVPNRPADGDPVCDAWEKRELPFEINGAEDALLINVLCAQHMIRRANGLTSEGLYEHDLVIGALGPVLVRHRSKSKPRPIGTIGSSW